MDSGSEREESAASRGVPRGVVVAVGVVLVAAVAAAGVFVVARARATSEYCAVYDSTHAELVAAMDAVRALPARPSSFEESEAHLATLNGSLERMRRVAEQRRDAAPGEIRGAWEVLAEPVKEDRSLSEERAERDAVEAVNRFAEDRCGLPGDM